MKYIITANADRTECGLLERRNHDANPKLQLDNDGVPLEIIDEFEKDTWEEAKVVYAAWLATTYEDG